MKASIYGKQRPGYACRGNIIEHPPEQYRRVTAQYSPRFSNLHGKLAVLADAPSTLFWEAR
jgi:hypothetical protein